MINTEKRTFTFGEETFIEVSDLYKTNDDKITHFFARKIDDNEMKEIYSFFTTDYLTLSPISLTLSRKYISSN